MINRVLLIHCLFLLFILNCVTTKKIRYEDVYALETCNIPEEFSWIDGEEFRQRYANGRQTSKPVVFRRMPLNKQFLRMLDLDTILSRHGHRSITVTSANTYSYTKQSMKLNDYIQLQRKSPNNHRWGNETVYWFGDDLFNDQHWLQQILRYYKAPPYTVEDFTQPSLSFGMGGQGTGVPFHFHGPGFQQMIVGRKRWYLSFERPSFDPNETTIHWAIDRESRPIQPFLYECTLHPGDVIFFPNLWWHATLNLDFGIFLSTFLSL